MCHEKDKAMEGLRTCNKCGWVHFAVTRKHAEEQVAEFKVYFDGLPEKQQNEFYGGKPSSIKDYETCNLCGGSHTNFRDAKYGDVPDGCTISPIIKKT